MVSRHSHFCSVDHRRPIGFNAAVGWKLITGFQRRQRIFEIAFDFKKTHVQD